MSPEKYLLIDIDGLRPDVFRQALDAGSVPNLARLVGRGLHIPITAPAPSITFCSQACLFTGAHPAQHGIPGNQFFDRFGGGFAGAPRHFAFDVGDTLAVDDAVRVFSDGLAAGRLEARTIYERLASQGRTSLVAGNMYARGATRWIRPSLSHLARFTKGGNLFGLDSRSYDQHVLDTLLDDLAENGLPDLTTMYFMGLDHDSHLYGPGKGQLPYLVEHVDPMVGQLWQAVQEQAGGSLPLVAVFSDHGQIEVIPDDRHSLRIGFPFDKEMGHLFSALGLDVHDFPGEDPNCDAVMALNGGLASVYLQKRDGSWQDPPIFERDVVPVGRAFWEAHAKGRYAAELEGALSGVLLRNVEVEGWQAPYTALTADGNIQPLEVWFASQPGEEYLDPVNRLNHCAGRYAGDLLLVSNYADGFYFGGEIRGVHGGLHPADSHATLAFGWPEASPTAWEPLKNAVEKAVYARCRVENNRMAHTTDMITGLNALIVP